MTPETRQEAKMNARRFVHAISLSALLAAGCWGQNVISAKSGLVHYIDGDVFINDKPVEMKSSVFAEVVGPSQVLRTGEEGRAEVLLTPGVFLRVAEASSFRMISNKLSDTKLEALSGSLLLEVAEVLKDNAVTLVYKDNSISIEKSGLYRLDVTGGSFRVYAGEAVVTRAAATFTVKSAKSVQLDDAVLTASKFDNKTGDDFYRWASRRASYLSIANIASAKQAYDNRQLSTFGWTYNPWYNMFTYMPYSGYYLSPFGYGFWSPSNIGGIVYPNYGRGGGGFNNNGGGNTFYDSSRGYNVGPRGSDMGTSTPSALSSNGSVSNANNGAVSSRGGDTGGSRGGSSGGGRGH